eukprot:399283-Rhodomonas_salina.7
MFGKETDEARSHQEGLEPPFLAAAEKVAKDAHVEAAAETERRRKDLSQKLSASAAVEKEIRGVHASLKDAELLFVAAASGPSLNTPPNEQDFAAEPQEPSLQEELLQRPQQPWQQTEDFAPASPAAVMDSDTRLPAIQVSWDANSS